MAEYTFPQNQLQNADFLLGIMGSHWTNVYQGNNLVAGLAYSRAQEELQALNDLNETVAALAKDEVPIYHTDNWYFLIIKESELNNRALAYGDGTVYGDNSGLTYNYGDSYNPDLDFKYEFPVPDDLSDVKTILNRLTGASLILTKGADYALQPSKIFFRQNPFEDDRVAKRDVLSGSEVVDREAALWLYKGQFDWQHIYTHFGYVLSLQLKSSESYRRLVSSVFDCLVEGTSSLKTNYALAAMLGVPIALEEETVELITEDNNYLIIATDKNVYKCSKEASAVVSVGDELHPGDWIVDTITTYDLNTGVVPDVTSVTAGVGFLTDGFADGISFSNKDVDIQVEYIDGKTKVSFELGGLPTDVDRFWDLVHERGLAGGKTLANYLDLRDDPTDEPLASSLPSTINPLQFLVENILRYNAFVVKIKVNAISGELVGRLLRKIVPPWTACILLLDIALEDPAIMLENAATETEPGYVETVGSFTGAEVVEETIDGETSVTEVAKLRLVNGICR